MKHNNEFTYLFSQQHADKYGYSVAKLEDGSVFKYTKGVPKGSLHQNHLDEYLGNYNDARIVFDQPNTPVYGSPFLKYTNEKPYVDNQPNQLENKIDSTIANINACKEKFLNNSSSTPKPSI